MSLYDSENPQHLDHLARAKAVSRRATGAMNAAERVEGMAEAREAAKIHWSNKRAAA